MQEERGTNDDSVAESQGPVGKGEHVVRQGECLASIAKAHGHFWKTLWDHPGNAELKRTRKDPNILRPGDRVTIPPLRRKEASGSTESRHRFVLRNEPIKLRLRLVKRKRKRSDSGGGAAAERPERASRSRLEEEPRADEPYTLEIDGRSFEGTTDGDGCLEVAIPQDAERGRLFVGRPPHRTMHTLRLGGVDPIEELSGVQHRLNNLGLRCGQANGELGPSTREALRRFQREHELKESGQPDQATRDKLVEVHGS